MKLSQKEIDVLLQRLRERYDKYGKKYSCSYFNREGFEERVRFAYEKRMDIAAFMLAEVANFEKLKEKYEKQKNKGSFSKKVEKIIEEQLERIEKYPKREFHPRAGIEASCMYGALYHLADALFPILWIIVDDPESREMVRDIEHEISYFAQPALSRLPRYTEDFALFLARVGLTELEVEKTKNNYLKETAFLLFNVADFCDILIRNPQQSFELPIQFSKSFESPDRKHNLTQEFSSLTGFGAIFKIKHYCEDAIADFRLTAFKPTNASSYR